MSRTALTWAALAGWAVAFGGAFVAYAVTIPDDFGFTAGLNRIEAFLGWQVAAAALSLACAVLARGLARGSRARRLGLVPIWVTGALLLGIVGLVVWGMRPS